MRVSELKSILEEVLRLERAGEAAVLLTLVDAGGSTPRHDVARMVVRRDGSTLGTIGGGAIEHDMVGRAKAMLAEGSTEPALAETELAAVGMVCGGRVKVLLEPVGTSPPLILFGAGHVALEVAGVAARCGFSVHVVDDRPEFASADRFPEARTLVHSFEADEWDALPLDEHAYCVIVTRGHEHDYQVVEALIQRPLAYLGMIGSRRKVAATRQRLADAGVEEASLEGLHAPIGVDIGSETPAEIAVSIVAEMIATRRHR